MVLIEWEVVISEHSVFSWHVHATFGEMTWNGDPELTTANHPGVTFGAQIPSPWWRHQMETFSALLAICAENSPVPGEFPTQRPVTRSFDVYFDLRPNKGLSKQLWGWWFETLSYPLWRHRNARVYFWQNFFIQKNIFLPKSLAKVIFFTKPHKNCHFVIYLKL